MLRNLFAVILMGIMGLGAYAYVVTRDLPSVEKALQDGINPTKWTQVLAADGTPILSFGKFHHENVRLANVSPYFVDALIATEDRRFFQHRGVDPVAVARAIVSDLTHKQMREGGSTITQQLARNVFLTNERSFSRKLREAALAMKLEDKLTKNQILELYVNNTYFGEGAYGIKAASEIYFGKTPSRLSIEEAALLAGLPQAPSGYSPYQNMKGALERRNEVLANLAEVGKVTADELKRLQSRPIRLSPGGRTLSSSDKAPFFNRYVMEQVMKSFSLDEQSFWQSGLKIYTTLDLHAQRLASSAVSEQSAVYGRTRLSQQAALVSINAQTGAILAYVGGKDYQQSQFDRASHAIRSPGSLFKIFTYTTAIDRGYEPTRVYLDEPVRIGSWQPQNYDRGYHGYMTIARALMTSNNMVAVKVINELGADTVVRMAQQMGIHSPLEPYLGLTLGGSGVNLLEITSAFGVLANQGVRVEPYAIVRVVDDSGREIYREHPVKTNVLNRTTVDTMVKMMESVVSRGTARAADIGRPMAGKTGTSDDYRDAWFVGFTPDVVTGVWVGNDNNTPMRGMTGGSLPSVIWRSFMKPYMSNRPAQNFDLAYSKPLEDSDFTNYDIKNLSDKETGKGIAATTLQDGEMQSDPNAPGLDPLVDGGAASPNATAGGASSGTSVDGGVPSDGRHFSDYAPSSETQPSTEPSRGSSGAASSPVQPQPMPGYGNNQPSPVGNPPRGAVNTPPPAERGNARRSRIEPLIEPNPDTQQPLVPAGGGNRRGY